MMESPVTKARAKDGPPEGLSESYWAKLSVAEQAMYRHIRPLPKAKYRVEIHLSGLERFLESQAADMEEMGGTFELVPDFQRGHVWSPEQQVRYVGSFLRGCAPKSILFNCPGYTDSHEQGGIPDHTFQCIDGLQRLTALRLYVSGQVEVFERYRAGDFKGTAFAAGRYTVGIGVHVYAWRSELLQFYLDLNIGGTAHSRSELDRVGAMLQEASRSGPEQE